MSKEKAVNFRIIDKEDPAWGMIERARSEWHKDLIGAKIGLAWRINLNPDVDGGIVLGKCVKISELQREFIKYDFVVVLNEEYWNSFTEAQQVALIDHELCHAAPMLDKVSLEQIFDERGRPVWRTRKHNIEEFTEVIGRHGVWKKDLVEFALALGKAPEGDPNQADIEVYIKDVESAVLDGDTEFDAADRAQNAAIVQYKHPKGGTLCVEQTCDTWTVMHRKGEKVKPFKCTEEDFPPEATREECQSHLDRYAQAAGLEFTA